MVGQAFAKSKKWDGKEAPDAGRTRARSGPQRRAGEAFGVLIPSCAARALRRALSGGPWHATWRGLICSTWPLTKPPGEQVFDGHGGEDAAHYARDHILANIIASDSFPAETEKAMVRALPAA